MEIMNAAANPPLLIRPMTEADLDAVVAIENVSFPTPWKRAHFQQELTLTYSLPLVAEQHGQIVGFLCLMSLFEEAQILDVAVTPGQRGSGVAQVLIRHAEQLAREKGAHYLELEVRVSNTPARRLYQKLGYAETGIRPRYYDGKEDAVLMEKKLIEPY